MMVRVAGVEPALLSEQDFESSAIPAVATRSVVEIEKQRLPERAILVPNGRTERCGIRP